MSKKVLIATYSRTGNTQEVADQLAELFAGADRYQIQVPEDTYSIDMYETNDLAQKQVATGNFPHLTEPLPDFSQYDLILVGSPVWSGMPAAPVHTFLEKLQSYQGQVSSFYTDAGTPGNYEAVFKEWAGGLRLLPQHQGPENLSTWVYYDLEV